MTNIKQEIKTGFVIGLTFLITVCTGGIIYAAVTLTATSDEVLSASKWNNMISTLTTPTGAIMAFNLAVCPSGWVAADGINNPLDLRGAFLRGIGGNSNGRDVARTLGDYQADIFASHSHQYQNNKSGHGLWEGSGNSTVTYEKGYKTYTNYDTTAVGGTETRPKNVAVLYCIKQ